MGHYARIENNRVVEVVVCEPDFLTHLPEGEWVQTSYNTRNGVHYGPDGAPSGKPGMRKNFARPGDVYDRKLDAFYPEKPHALFVLDADTGSWVPNVRPSLRGVSNEQRKSLVGKKLYIQSDTYRLGLDPIAAYWLESQTGVTLVANPSHAQATLALGVGQMEKLVISAACSHLSPADESSWKVLTDRVARSTLGELVLPSKVVTPDLLEDAKFEGPVFVAPRLHAQPRSPWDYTSWSAMVDLEFAIDTAANEFWGHQKFRGQLTVQEGFACPFDTLDMRVVIDTSRKVNLLRAFNTSWKFPQQRSRQRTANPEQLEQAAGLLPGLQAIADQLSLRAGVHEIQFVSQPGGQWKMRDWQPGFNVQTADFSPISYPIFEDVVLLLFGEKQFGRMDGIYSEYRAYENCAEHAQLAIGCGLIPQADRIDSSVSGFTTTAASVEEATARFVDFETQIGETK